MAIGRMINPQLNNRRNEWYEKRNHVRIPRIAESKKWLDAFYTEGDSGVDIPVYDTGWSAQSYRVGTPITPIPLAALFTGSPATFAGTNLPAWASIVSDEIVGTPTAVATISDVSITATNSAGDANTGDVDWVVAARIPRFVQGYQGTSDPAIPAAGALWTQKDAARDKFIAIATNLTATPPTIAGFTPLAVINGAAQSMAIYELPGSTTSYAWVGATQHKRLAHLRDCGRIAVKMRFRSGGGTSFIWGPLTAGDGDILEELTGEAILSAFAVANGIQTDFDLNGATGVGLGSPFTTRLENNASPARYIADTAGTLPTTEVPSETLLTGFAQVSKVLDTTAAYVNVMWGAQGAET